MSIRLPNFQDLLRAYVAEIEPAALAPWVPRDPTGRTEVSFGRFRVEYKRTVYPVADSITIFFDVMVNGVFYCGRRVSIHNQHASTEEFVYTLIAESLLRADTGENTDD